MQNIARISSWLASRVSFQFCHRTMHVVIVPVFSDNYSYLIVDETTNVSTYLIFSVCIFSNTT